MVRFDHVSHGWYANALTPRLHFFINVVIVTVFLFCKFNSKIIIFKQANWDLAMLNVNIKINIFERLRT